MNDNHASVSGHCHTVRDVMRVLSGERRFEIVLRLAQTPRQVTPLADDLERELSAVSHELQILRRHGCVEQSRTGTCREYRLSERIRIVPFADAVWLEATSDDGGRVLVQGPDIPLEVPPEKAPEVPPGPGAGLNGQSGG